MKVYKIKSLIKGHKVSPKLRGKILVCCKAGKGYSHIQYENKIMKLKEMVHSLAFADKFGRGSYFLDYFEWKPVDNLWEIK